MVTLACSVEAEGFAVAPAALGEQEIKRLILAAGRAAAAAPPSRAGIRDAFRAAPETRELAAAPAVRGAAGAILGQSCFAVRAILFDKTPRANWTVPFHQDLTIAVRARHDVPGYGPWSTKAGMRFRSPMAAARRPPATCCAG